MRHELFGQFLIDHEVITPEQLQDALKIQLDTGVSFGELCISKQYLDEEAVKRVLLSQWQTNKQFGEIALSLDLLTTAQVKELLKIQALFHKPLGEILVRLKHITQTELMPWLEQFKNEDRAQIDVLRTLKKVDLFTTLNTKELANISLLLKIKTYADEDIIYREGDPSEFLYLIESGTVEITMPTTSGRIDVNVVIDGNNFGLHSLLNRKPQTEQARAIGKVTLWYLSWEDLHGLLVEYPSLPVTALKLLSNSIDNLVSSIVDEDIRDIYLTALVLDDAQLPSLTQDTLGIVHKMTAEIPGKTLLLSCTGEAAPAASNTLQVVTLPNSTNISRIKETIRTTQKRDPQVSGVIICLSTHSTHLLKTVLDMVAKSAILLYKHRPPLEAMLRAEQDRLYFVHDKPDKINFERYEKEFALKSSILVPSMFYVDDLNSSTTGVMRWLLGRTIGLAFGGGGARTMSNVGVLEVLEEEGISVDFVSGTSGGALFAGLYGIGLSAAEIKHTIAKSIAFGKDSPANDFTLTMKTIIKGKKYRNVLKRAFGDRYACGTRIPAFFIATDINNGREVIVNRCRLWEAAYVSAAIPGFSPLLEINGLLLGEGGLVDNVPSTVLKNAGADLVISMNCSPDLRSTPLTSTSMSALFGRSLDILIQQSVQLRSHYTDIEIRPQVGGYGLFEFRKGMETFALGRQAVLERLPEIKEKITALKNNCIVS